MAIVTNTYQTTSAVGNREELSDVVSRITPEDTPIYTLIGSGKLASKHPEWEYDDLRAPAANAQLEGDTYTFNATVAPTRVGNYTQIFRESWSISNTQDAVDNAGNVEKRKEQKLKKAVQVKKDVEFAIVSNTASVSGATRSLGALPSWLTTNVSRGAAGANGGFSSGTGLTVAETTGTQRAFTKALLDATMQSVYTSGGNATHLVVSPYVKSVFVTFMSDTNVASFRYAAGNATRNTIVGTADIYEGPFGKVTVVPDRIMATSAAVARRAFLIDPDMASFDWLRPISEDPGIAKIADAEQGVIIGEGTLRIKNEKGLGVIADLFGLTAST
jgi:hypothetical protein